MGTDKSRRDGRTARRHHTGILRRGVWCASRRPHTHTHTHHPWASASSYLSSQSLADSRCSLHATSRSSHSRRSFPCRFFFCRVALLCLVLRRRRRLPFPCSHCFLRLSAQLRPPRCISWPLPRVYRALLAQGRVFGRPLLSFATQSCHCSGPLSLRTLVPSLMMPALGSPSGASCRLTTGFPLVRPPRSRLTPLPSARLYVRYVRRGSPSMPWTGALSTLYSSLVPLPVPWSCRCFAPMSVWQSRLPSPLPVVHSSPLLRAPLSFFRVWGP